MTLKILYLGNSEKHSLQEGLPRGKKVDRVLLTTEKSDQALTLFNRELPQVVLVDFDQDLPNRFEFIRHLLNKPTNNFKVIGLTETCPLRVVMQAVKMGVKEVINTREEPEKLQRAFSEYFRQCQEFDKGEDRHQKQRQKYELTNIVGESPEIKRVFEVISKIVGRKWVTVLLRGETGTGKELAARAIHYHSFTQFQPFVEINCNALPESLLESELFGYEKGAFTDAKTQKKGLFELAQNGTLFLDEIGEVTPKIQVKLLKALEEKRIRRLGGTQEHQINTRIIAATNRDLQSAIRDGHFRNDLYYRLNVVSIHLPPLRDRGDDVILLARHFLSHYGEQHENPVQGFTAEAEALLRSYHWPGNIRELKHTIERIVLLTDEKRVTHESMSEALESETPLILTERSTPNRLQIPIPEGGLSLEEGEQFLIKAVLENTGWNKRKTCQILKISRPRLDRKIKKYNLLR